MAILSEPDQATIINYVTTTVPGTDRIAPEGIELNDFIIAIAESALDEINLDLSERYTETTDMPYSDLPTMYMVLLRMLTVYKVKYEGRMQYSRDDQEANENSYKDYKERIKSLISREAKIQGTSEQSSAIPGFIHDGKTFTLRPQEFDSVQNRMCLNLNSLQHRIVAH